MSTVVGLVKKDQQLINLTGKLEALGFGLDTVKILTDPEEAQTLLYKKNYAQCHLFDCMAMGALFGVAISLPLAFLTSVFSCYLLGGCTALAWGPGIVFLAITGAIVGASLGSYVSTHRLERSERVYVEGLDSGSKLVVVSANTDETTTRTVNVMEQEHAVAIQILDNQD